jgi:transposase
MYYYMLLLPKELQFHFRALHAKCGRTGSVDTSLLEKEVFPMGKTHVPYSAEFRRQMIELVRAGRQPEDLAREFEPSAQAIRNWVAQADRDEGRWEDGVSSAEREELARLRRENRQLRLERDILAKAAAWFARA